MLSADSIAYDKLPAGTSRPSLFPGDCRQFVANPALATALGAAEPPFDDTATHSCVIRMADETLAVFSSTEPGGRHPEPWREAWMADAGGITSHFRRELVLDRYYAVFSVTANGCDVGVNTGAPGMLSMSTLHKRDLSVDRGHSVEEDRRLAAEFCPTTRKLIADYLTVADPGGGSLATN